jgi:hypothetical protein
MNATRTIGTLLPPTVLPPAFLTRIPTWGEGGELIFALTAQVVEFTLSQGLRASEWKTLFRDRRWAPDRHVKEGETDEDSDAEAVNDAREMFRKKQKPGPKKRRRIPEETDSEDDEEKERKKKVEEEEREREGWSSASSPSSPYSSSSSSVPSVPAVASGSNVAAISDAESSSISGGEGGAEAMEATEVTEVPEATAGTEGTEEEEEEDGEDGEDAEDREDGEDWSDSESVDENGQTTQQRECNLMDLEEQLLEEERDNPRGNRRHGITLAIEKLRHAALIHRTKHSNGFQSTDGS